MSLNANDQQGGGPITEPMAPGTYPARVVVVADLGLQAQQPFNGKDKAPVRMLNLTYEFVDEFLKDEDGNDQTDKPRWLSERFAFYNISADKAKSTLRYKALDPAGVHGGDFTKLVNTPCMVTVIHNPNKKNKGRVYENVHEVSPMRERDANRCPPLVNQPVVFDLDEPDLVIFNKFPKFLQKTIKDNLNFAGSKLEALLKNQPVPKEEAKVDKKESAPVVDGDENPY